MHFLSPHTSGTSSNQDGENTSGSFQIRALCIALPEGSGAIEGIDEKFGTNPAPSGFGPQFSSPLVPALARDLSVWSGPFYIFDPADLIMRKEKANAG